MTQNTPSPQTSNQLSLDQKLIRTAALLLLTEFAYYAPHYLTGIPGFLASTGLVILFVNLLECVAYGREAKPQFGLSVVWIAIHLLFFSRV